MQSDQEPPLLVYAKSISVHPGDDIEFCVSSHLSAHFKAQLFRSVCADPNPSGPGIIEHRVSCEIDNKDYPSRVQKFYPGSYGISHQSLTLNTGGGFSLSAHIFPTLINGKNQVIFSVDNLIFGLDSDGRLTFSLDDYYCTLEQKVKLRRWYRVMVSYDAEREQLSVSLCDKSRSGRKNEEYETTIPVSFKTQSVSGKAAIAARIKNEIASGFFNGKIEHVKLFSAPGRSSMLAHWNFSIDISSTNIHDECGNFHGRLVNFPARAMTGAKWDGTEMNWQHCPDHYGAIHFHEDDIVDFEWETDFTLTLPQDLSSGIYVLRIYCEEYEDAVPFFVCPGIDSNIESKQGKLALLVSTFTYAIYGNHARPDFKPSWKQRMQDWNAYPWNPAEYQSYGLSTYNFHSDGSGICHASFRRPLFNMKPGYLTFCYGDSSGLRHFQADSHLISWLHHHDIPYDIITDQYLDQYGAEGLQGYTTLCTGTHPEYHTENTLNALTDFQTSGGNFIYLGGNGFYWKIATHPENDSVIEIRRAEDGIRAWAAEPGEYYQAFDGAYGGLWRRSGRPPQLIAGVGFSAQGQFEGTYYKRQNFDPNMEWVFAGIDDDILGDFGLSGGGAAGFELDRVDYRLGSPEGVVILAASETTRDSFVLVPEEQLTHITTWPGQPAEELLHADMVYFERESGARVFSTGSITFCGSLPVNEFNNNISKLLLNITRSFLSSS